MITSDRSRALLSLAIVVPAPSLGAAAAFFLAPGPLGSAIYAGAKLWLYGAPLVLLLLVERRPISWSRPRRGGFLAGALLGLALAAAVLVGWLAFGALVDPAPLRRAALESGFDRPLVYLGIALWLMLVNSALEEYVFRWFIQSRWESVAGARAAVPLAALCFTAHHVIVLRAFFPWPLALLCSAGVLAGGLAWSWCYARYGSIWPGWLSHALVDAAVLGVGYCIVFG